MTNSEIKSLLGDPVNIGDQDVDDEEFTLK